MIKPRLAKKLTYEQLMEYTDNFSEDNFLGTVQFGKVYRGIIKEGIMLQPRHVMVKIWEELEMYQYYVGDNEARLMIEIMLLRDERLKSHQDMIELYGYVWDDELLGAVYNFNPLDTLHNLLAKDSFTWLQRIKVAIEFARFLKLLHTGQPAYKPFLLRNTSAAHIVLDEEYNPKVFDFGMITGGIFPDRTIYKRYYLPGFHGYVGVSDYKWSDKSDVFSFGCLLLYLITKEEEQRSPSIDDWAWTLYAPINSVDESDNKDRAIKKPVRSLVHHSLTLDNDFSYTDGRKITKLAMKCINYKPEQCPNMKRVMRYLLKLQIVKKHAESLGLQAGVEGW